MASGGASVPRSPHPEGSYLNIIRNIIVHIMIYEHACL